MKILIALIIQIGLFVATWYAGYANQTWILIPVSFILGASIIAAFYQKGKTG